MKANLKLINQRTAERDMSIQKAKFVEEFESEGLTSDDLKQEAKEMLGLPETAIVRIEADEVVKEQNKKLFAFTQIVNQLAYLEGAGVLSEEAAKKVRESAQTLTNEVANILQVEVEDLFEEVDDEFLTGKESE